MSETYICSHRDQIYGSLVMPKGLRVHSHNLSASQAAGEHLRECCHTHSRDHLSQNKTCYRGSYKKNV